MILGLDVGGANTKAASSDGLLAKSIYLPLWRGAPLDQALDRLAEMAPEALGVVMTGELADCYPDKASGVASIKSAVEMAFQCPIRFWGVNGFAWRDLRELAGANWSASAALVAREMGDCLFVDMGSTTTDIIPIIGRPLAETTDLGRLANGELVYSGMLRTSLGSLLPSVILDGNSIPLSPEFFAITADAYLAMGEIAPEEYTCDAPDGRGKDRASALRRIARTVCADLEEIGKAGALAIAEQACFHQFEVIAGGLERQSRKHGLDRVVAAGMGEKVIARAAAAMGMSCLRLSERYGTRISEIFPAFAVAKLLETELSSGC
jgi:probable H4MPT-linked C1 transfer pathway protein